jgi:hypothetical protein
MKYNHKFTCQILPVHHNEGHNGLHFRYFEGRKNALEPTYIEFIFILIFLY